MLFLSTPLSTTRHLAVHSVSNSAGEKKKGKKKKGLIFKTLHKFICLLWSSDFSGLFGIKTFCLCDIFGGIDNRFVSHGYEYGNVRVSH